MHVPHGRDVIWKNIPRSVGWREVLRRLELTSESVLFKRVREESELVADGLGK
jgi:hypothetical protein